MAKDNGVGDGILSISKSQKNRGKKLAQLAKQGGPIKHGGICSSCGQSSNSCTPGTVHDICLGYVQNYDFGDPSFNLLAKSNAMLADGTIISRPISGKWIDKAELLQLREERLVEGKRIIASKVIMASVFEEVEPEIIAGDDPKTLVTGLPSTRKFVRLDVTNGLGEPISYLGGAWLTPDQALEYYGKLLENQDGLVVSPEKYQERLEKNPISAVEPLNLTEEAQPS